MAQIPLTVPSQQIHSRYTQSGLFYLNSEEYSLQYTDRYLKFITETCVRKKAAPSAGWKSYDGWYYNDMKERLERFMGVINKHDLLQHAQSIIGQQAIISEAFYAGQFWCFFELVAADGRLIIALLRHPRHPNSAYRANDYSELYSMQCEVAIMEVLHENVTGVPLPRLYFFRDPESQRALEVGAYVLCDAGTS